MELESLSGKIFEGDYRSRIYEKGITFHYQVHVPEYTGQCALNVSCDGMNRSEAYAMQVLAQSGEVPYCITVGVIQGRVCNGMGEGKDRYMRMGTYDMVNTDYPNFLVEELIPFLVEKYDLNIYDHPDMHMTSGGSSGGISAWNIAWQRNDYFRRVYMSSPSFLAMGGGNEYPVLIRKYETKPIRVYVDYSENEPDDYFGSSYCAALESIKALKFAGYDMMSKYYPGEGHCSRKENVDSAIERMRFLWKNWETEPVTAKGLSTRMQKVISADCGWEKTCEQFPKKNGAVSLGICSAAGEYTATENEICFTPAGGEKRKVAEGFLKISALALSADKRRLYIGDLDRGCVYASLILPDGGLEGRFLHALLHHEPDYNHSGTIDLCTSADDRVFAATELGIQLVRSFGLIDVILSLPFGKVPEKIEFGETDRDYLYALADGTVYRRKILDGGRAVADQVYEPQNTSYFN